MKIITGQTVYETIMSIDSNNNPISAATFSTILYKNGIFQETLFTSLTDDVNDVCEIVQPTHHSRDQNTAHRHAASEPIVPWLHRTAVVTVTFRPL